MKYFISFVIFILALGVSVGLYTYKPKTKKNKPRASIPIVKAIEIHKSDHQVFVEAYGTVVPGQSIELKSEVEGKIVKLNQSVIPGGLLKDKEFVFQVDPVDYSLQVKGRLAEVAGAQYELDLERGKQVVAKQEWARLKNRAATNGSGKSLALREPHLEYAKARLQAAKSRLELAEILEKRTSVHSPFDSLILNEFVEVGQLVGRQTLLATLVGTDYFWIQVSVPLWVLDRLVFSDDQQQGSEVRVILKGGMAGHSTVTRTGKLFKLLGELDEKTRMARILIKIKDPLYLEKNTENVREQLSFGGKVLLGSYVKVMIDAGKIKDVYALPRQLIREGDKVWIVTKEGKLAIRSVEILWKRAEDMLVSIEIFPGEKVVTSRLQSPLQDMMVRIAGVKTSLQSKVKSQANK